MAEARRLPGGPDRPEIRVEFEGQELPARDGEPLAAALLAGGIEVFSRSVKYHRARGPYCLAARCSHCLMRVNGEPNVFTCVVPARDGMVVERQNAFPSAEVDVFRAVDWLYPRGLDHHALFAGIPVVELAVARVAREMAGLGTLPEMRPPARVQVEVREVAVLVVGAGPAGLAASRAAAGTGALTLLVDEHPEPGGRLGNGLSLPGDPPADHGATEVAALEREGGSFVSGFVLAAYRDGSGRLLVPVRTSPGHMLLVRAQALVVATGGTEPPALFGNNELPGVFAARALARLVSRDRVLPGTSALLYGTGPEAVALADLLGTVGCEVVGLVGEKPPSRGRHLPGSILRARGRSKVAGAIIQGPAGTTAVRCDMVAVADAIAPLFDLGRQAGAEVRYEGDGFALVAGDSGTTSAPDVFACGEVTGPCDATQAMQQGRSAGLAAAGRAR